MREVPFKNYVVLFVIMLVSVAFVFYLKGWYNASKEYYAVNSVIKDSVSEINENEIENYIVESQKFVLYASSGSLEDVKNFEVSLKKIIDKLDIYDNVLYLNLDGVDVSSFNSKLKNMAYNNRVFSMISNDSNCVIYLFENGKIKYVLNDANKYSRSYIESLFESWGGLSD